MLKSENLIKFVRSMNNFRDAFNALMYDVSLYEQRTGESVNSVPGFCDLYPFNKSLDELYVNTWVDAINYRVNELVEFKVLRYQYLNTGGNTMVGIFDVWLPARNQVAYALTNDEGCTLSTVDYISNELQIDDYDAVIIDTINWEDALGGEKYFELYRYCLNEYLKSDCRYFGYCKPLPYHLLSDELKNQVSDAYMQWMNSHEYTSFDTDGEHVIFRAEYHEDCYNAELASVKAFKRWHDDNAAVVDLYSEPYTIEIAGHKVSLPYNADVWDSVDDLLTRAIETW